MCNLFPITIESILPHCLQGKLPGSTVARSPAAAAACPARGLVASPCTSQAVCLRLGRQTLKMSRITLPSVCVMATLQRW